MIAVVGIVSRCGLRIDMNHRNSRIRVIKVEPFQQLFNTAVHM